MGQKVSRREAMGRCGAALLGAALATMSGVERLAYAAAAEMDGAVEPLRTDCGSSLNFCHVARSDAYGCTKAYGPAGCDDERWDCAQGDFAGCPAETIVYCTSDRDAKTFRCYNSTGNDPYGCTVRIFRCGTTGGGGFTCGDGEPVLGQYDFTCKESQGKFDCPVRFGQCNPPAGFRAC